VVAGRAAGVHAAVSTLFNPIECEALWAELFETLLKSLLSCVAGGGGGGADRRSEYNDEEEAEAENESYTSKWSGIDRCLPLTPCLSSRGLNAANGRAQLHHLYTPHACRSMQRASLH
jgi:hypothetical protein